MMESQHLSLKGITDQIYPIDHATFKLLTAKCFSTNLKKGKVILNAGEQDTHLRFIIKGVVKAYRIADAKDGSNREMINFIVDEGKVACSVVSLFQKKPSTEYLETVEDTELLCISIADLEALIESQPAICKLISKWCIEYLVLYDKRIDIYRHAKPENRLQLFAKTQPKLLKRLSKKEIASYLDISPGTLSGIFQKI
jgi:CRP-like cAMP-binding protein